MKKKKLIANSLLAVFCGLFLFGSWKVWTIRKEYRDAASSFHDLTQFTTVSETPAVRPEAGTSTDPSDTPTKSTDDTVWPEVDFEALQQINPDIVGWIYIDGTTVNYPIVQGDDNSYYLNRLIDGTQNSSGSIFLDCDSEADFSGQNSVIYGHRMKNGTMFHNLLNYKKQSYYDEHAVGLLLTPQGNYKIQFFSGYVAKLSDPAWDLFFTDEPYEQWLSAISERSCFASDVAPDATDRVVTLSTCSYEFDNARFVLHGMIQ